MFRHALFLLAATFSLVLPSHAFPQQKMLPRDGGSYKHQICKTAPGSPHWPSADTWTEFNTSVHGALIKTVPPGAVCHQGQPTYDAAKCPAVQASWTKWDFHVASPVTSMWNQYNNDTCLPLDGTPCSPAGYPAYAVNCTTADQVSMTLKFAAKYNIRVVVKSSGHDYQGRSTAPGALTIYVHYMSDVTTLNDFKPTGCGITIPGTAAKAGGGTPMLKLQTALDKIGQVAIGGGGQTVSVGGYITGGGHSILAPRYGLAADQVLEVEVVTPKGDIVIANECRNQDLFWAIRGGGGSTFGVVTSFTIATHPSPKLVAASNTMLVPVANQSWFADMTGYLVSQFPYFDAHNISGYSYIVPAFPNPSNASLPPVSVVYSLFILQDTQKKEDMAAIWQPVVDHINKTWSPVSPILNYTAYPSFLTFWNDFHDADDAGKNQWVGSHLLDADSVKNASAVADAYRILNGGTAYLVAGKGVQNAKPRGGSNSVGSTWRKALIHATNGGEFPPLNLTARAQSLKKVNDEIEGLRKLAPYMGAYINENNPAEPNWQKTFWGDNYARLASIKKAVDPDDIMWCHPCVGNEHWEEIGYQLCRKC